MKGNQMKTNGSWLMMVGLFMLMGCNSTKYIADNEYLYEKGEVTIHNDTIPEDRKEAFETHLEDFLRPQPTSKFKIALWNMGGGPDTTVGFIKRWIKRQGAPPVLLSEVNREYNENLLRNRMENLGYFHASVTSDTLLNGQKATVEYDATTGRVFRINEVEFDVDSTQQIGRDILYTQNQTLLRKNQNYNLDVIIRERERIDVELKNKGYYYFNADHLLLEVDSMIGDHKVDMFMTLKPETPATAKQPQRIGRVIVFPNHTQQSGEYSRRIPRNTELYDNQYYIVDRNNTYRNKVLANHIFFEPGELYNRNDHNMTINHFVNLNTFQFVKNDFVDSPDSSNTMDVYYYLTPMKRKSIRFEVIGKTATVYNGTEANVNWTLRNAFKGFETLTFSVFGGFETQTGGNVNLNSSYIRYGAEAAISWPRLLSPYKWAPSRRYIPRTFLRVGYEFLDRRTAYTLNSMTLNYGYSWQENVRKTHDLTAAEIIYVQPRNITDEYREQMEQFPTLAHIIEPQFSFGPNYSYTFQNTMEDSKHTYYAKSGINTSGNVLGLIQGASFQDENFKTLFGTRYAQFVKAETDLRHYMKLTHNSTLVSRIMLGVSHSYGNSRSLPYLKQFFSGGPNGMRAFRARAVGPGTVNIDDFGIEDFFADQTGDFKLELNAEYRAQISGMFHWAAFVDAGNVWLQREDPDKPGGALSKDFYKQLAVGGGLGLRVDLDFLVGRLDVAIPFRVPYKTTDGGWVFNEINFGNRDWRSQNLVFNLAIGYPF